MEYSGIQKSNFYMPYKKDECINCKTIGYGRCLNHTTITNRNCEKINIIYPEYGQTDVASLAYNKLMRKNQIQYIQAKNYDDLLSSGMGPMYCL